MLYSFENGDDFGNIKRVSLVTKSPKSSRLQEEIGKPNFHEDM